MTPAIPSPANVRVLVVEDEPDLLEIVRIVLEEEGIEVLTESDGRRGLERAISDRPSLILLDMGLPSLSGEEFVKELRAALPEPPPIIVMSAAGTIVERAQRVGAVGRVAKPFDLDELTSTVQAALACINVGDPEAPIF